ncbi:MAG: CHAT domain-containing protein [Ignavibacteriaceae bacterium]
MKIIKQRVLISVPVIILLFSVIILILKGIYPGTEKIYTDALAAYNNWDNYKAEKLLNEIFPSDSSDLKILLLYGGTLFRLRELHKAKNIYNKIFAADSENKIEAQLKLSHINFFLSNLDSARNNLQIAEQLAENSTDSSALAASYNIKGLIEFNSLNYRAAMKDQKKSLSIALRIKNQNIIADALRQIGVLYWYSARYDSALNSFYKPALLIYRKINDKIGEATTLSDIGLLYKYEKNLEENIIYQLKAFGIRKKIGDKSGLADSYYFLSNSISMSGWRGSIIYAYLKKSYNISRDIGYKWGMEVASRALKDYYKSHELSSNIYSMQDTTNPVGEGIIYQLWNKSITQVSTGDLSGQVTTLEKLVNLDDSLGYKNGELVSLAFLASSLTRLGIYDKAQTALNKAAKIKASNHYSDYILDTTAARLYIASGRLKEAKNLLLNVTQKSDSAYLNYISQNNKRITGDNLSRIQRERSSAYSMLVDILFALNDKSIFETVQKDMTFSFWFRSNTHFDYNDGSIQTPFEKFVDLLDLYERNPDRYSDIQNLTGQFEIAQRNIDKINKVISGFAIRSRKFPVVSVRKIQNDLRKNEALVEFFVGYDNVYAIVLRKTEFKILKLNTSRSGITSLVNLYMDLLKRGYGNPDDKLWKGVSGKLNKILIEPLIINNLLKRDDHLIISADQVLHTLPFHTLDLMPADSAAQFLVEKYIISYIPSPAFLINSRRNKNRNYNSVIAIAPDTVRLAGTGKEINSIPRKYFLNFTSLTDGNVRRNRVLRSLKQYDIIHIAAHARVNPWFPLYSYIKCSDKDLKLYEILDENITAKLIILSACETGLGVSPEGGLPEDEDLLSFSRAFLLKGAGSVISSLWIVNDEATAELMKLFYQNMFSDKINSTEKIPIEFSLNDAQRQFITEHRKAGKSVHPFYWGAFFVSGDSGK